MLTLLHLLSPPSVPGPVSNVSVSVSPTNTFVSWTPPNAPGTIISQYIISYFITTCPIVQNYLTDNVTVSPPSTSTQLKLQSGQVYNISVKTANPLGESTALSVSFRTPLTEGMITVCINTIVLLLIMFLPQLPVLLQK